MGKNGWLDEQVAERRKGKNTLNPPLDPAAWLRKTIWEPDPSSSTLLTQALPLL